MTGWLRRLWRARREIPTVDRPLQVTIACDASNAVAALERVRNQIDDAIRTAPCEPTRAPDHVARAAANRATHYRALGEDPDANWGPYVNPYDEPGDAA